MEGSSFLALSNLSSIKILDYQKWKMPFQCLTKTLKKFMMRPTEIIQNGLFASIKSIKVIQVIQKRSMTKNITVMRVA